MIGFVEHSDNNKTRLLVINYLKSILKHVYGNNDKYIKKKIKLYGDKVNTYFQGKKYQRKCII